MQIITLQVSFEQFEIVNFLRYGNHQKTNLIKTKEIILCGKTIATLLLLTKILMIVE